VSDLSNDRFTVHLRGHYDVNGQHVACPHCGTDTGLTYHARPVDAEAMVTCPCGYDWWDERITGETVHDLHLALTGQPTRTTSLRIDGRDIPREPCTACKAIRTEIDELSMLAAAADGTEQQELRARLTASLGAWAGHLAEVHCGAPSNPKETR